jgi:hypothetical protein
MRHAPMETESAERVPFSRTKMRVLAVVGGISALIVLMGAFVERAEGDPDAYKLFWIGGVELAVMAALVLLAKRRGRI